MENEFKNLVILAKASPRGDSQIFKKPETIAFKPSHVTFYAPADDLVLSGAYEKMLSLLTEQEQTHANLIYIEFISGTRVVAAFHEYGLGDLDLFDKLELNNLSFMYKSNH